MRKGLRERIKSIYTPTTVQSDCYVMSDGYLCLPTGSVELGGFRWYLTISGGHEPSKNNAPIRIHMIDNESAGIRNVDADSRHNGKVYSLDGRVMSGSQLPSGVYIKNGKKFIVK